MIKKMPIYYGVRPLLPGLLLFLAGFAFAQEGAQTLYSHRFQNGTRLYHESRWQESAAEFRAAQESAGNPRDRSEALYWVIMTELASADYGSALRDMDILEKSGTSRSADIVYHRARAYYYLGYYEDSIAQFKRYNDSIRAFDRESVDRKAAAYFWMGECLYSMGQLEEAEKFYSWVLAKYPASPKVDVSSYRIDLIKRKKIETELLSLLKWSHEESLRTSEENQLKIKTYENTLNSYQRRVSELTQESRMNDLEESNAEYQRKLSEAENRISLLEGELTQSNINNLERARQLRNEAHLELQALENSRGGSQ
jgi:tetratricopeptide (TPR) repeat protein